MTQDGTSPRSDSGTAAGLVAELLELVGRDAAARFDVGDRVAVLHDDHGHSFRRLARLLGQSQARVGGVREA